MLSGANYDVSTVNLLRSTNALSVQQLTAFTTLISAQKSLFYQKPVYFAKRLALNVSSEENVVPQRGVNNIEVKAGLTVSRGGYFYRAGTLWNLLPDDMKIQMEPDVFKMKAKELVKTVISAKPT